MKKLRHRVVQGIGLDYKMIQWPTGDQKSGFLGPSLLILVHRHTQNTNIDCLLCGAGCSTSQEPGQPSSAFRHHHTALHHPNKSKIAPWGRRKTGKLLWTDPYFLVIRGVLTQIKEKGSLFFFSKANEVSKWREAVFLSRVGSISGNCPLIRNATINPHFPIDQCYSVPTVFGFCEAVKTEARCRKQIF